MSATIITLMFTTTVEDYEHWPEVYRDAIEDQATSPDEYVRDMLRKEMWQAGQKFIDQNKGLFRVPYLD